MAADEPRRSRRRTVIIVLVVVLFMAWAFFAGIVVQREIQLAPVKLSEAFIASLLGTDKPAPPAPTWEQWIYPGAQVQQKAAGPGFEAGALQIPASQYAVLTTSDAFDDVVQHYAQEHFDDMGGEETGAGSSFVFGSEPDRPIARAYVGDSRGNASEAGAALRARCLVHRSRSYDLTLFITRLDSEDRTHIIVIYDPKPTVQED